MQPPRGVEHISGKPVACMSPKCRTDDNDISRRGEPALTWGDVRLEHHPRLELPVLFAGARLDLGEREAGAGGGTEAASFIANDNVDKGDDIRTLLGIKIAKKSYSCEVDLRDGGRRLGGRRR